VGFLLLTWVLCFYMFGVSMAVQVMIAKSSDDSGINAVIDSISSSPVRYLHNIFVISLLILR
jgi:hypothetical protein